MLTAVSHARTPTDYALTQVLGSRTDNAKRKALREIFKLSEVVQARDYSVIHEVVLGLRSDQTLEHALLNNPQMVDSLDVSGRTALSWAVQRDDKDATAMLLNFHADATIADVAGMTPLHYATYTDDESCMELLLRQGIPVSPGTETVAGCHYTTPLTFRTTPE